MLLTSPDLDVRSIGAFLDNSGYTTEKLASELDLLEGLYATGENLEPLLLKTEGDALLSVLARLFFVGWPVDEERCARVIPESILNVAFKCGLLGKSNGQLEPLAALLPFRDHLIACDCSRLRGKNPEMVLGPGSATHFMARLAAGGQDETTLDVGSGPGVLAVEAAAYSRQVTGTDINARTLQFAKFTAAVNGVTNAEFLCGDTFTPVKGQRFTRIISNPPFFLTPGKRFTFSDSPLELDGFAQRLAQECAAYLEDGGYFQMICQWVDLEEEPWEQRLRDWTANSGCDVLVILAPTSKPISYAEYRVREARQTHGDREDFRSRVDYLRARKVRLILSGVITMRRRSGPNWFSILRVDPAGSNVGPGIRDRFQTLTVLATCKDIDLLAMQFRFAPDVILETTSAPTASNWKALSVELIKTETLVDRLKVDEAVAHALLLFDGERSLKEVAEAVCDRLSITREEATIRCLALVRRLLQGSFVLPGEQI